MNYNDVYQSALEAINETGRTVTLLKRNVSGYDPITNLLTDATDTTRNVTALFTSYKAKDIDGEIIQRGDKRCLIAGSVSKDEIVVDGADQYTIIDIEAVQPGETVILSKVQVRR